MNYWPRIRYFKPTERFMFSPDDPSTGTQMDMVFMFQLDALRGVWGKPLRSNSGYRTATRNREVGGGANSAHLLGRAADISTVGWSKADRSAFVDLARKIGFTGIGMGKTYIHIDNMPRIAAWRYVPGQKPPPVRVGDEHLWA